MNWPINQFLSRLPQFSRNRGQDIYDQHRYEKVELTPDQFSCVIKGTNEDYQVQIGLHENMITDVSCECMDFCRGNLCKHLYAAALVLKDEIQKAVMDQPIDIDFGNKKAVIRTYKNYVVSDFFNRKSMECFLNPYIQSGDKEMILTLFHLANRKREFCFFLDILNASSCREWFFSAVTKDMIPASFEKGFVEFAQEHDDLFALIKNEIISDAMAKNYGRKEFYISCFEQAMILNQKDKVKFFADQVITINAHTDEMLFRYLKKNERPENYTSYFRNRLANGQLYSFEYAFLYPYLTTAEKDLSLSGIINYRYKNYFYYPKEVDNYNNRQFVTENQTKIAAGNHTAKLDEMNIADFAAFRYTIFKDYKKIAFKRFKIVFGGFSRKRTVTEFEIYCIYLIMRDCIDDYYDELSIPLQKFFLIMNSMVISSPYILALVFELQKKRKKLDQHCPYVDFEEGTEGYDPMDVKKIDEKELRY